MPDEMAPNAPAAGNNSSDFVRKLYKMLEDPAYSEVVRWGDQGDSFVVLENEKFTKAILPKHFKHSNFASFVRQLNKYDFHKVRHNEENGQSPYGAQAWEFKHPEFRSDRKDNLDNIRRKAPAPRKVQNADDQFAASTHSFNIMSETLTATQHQVQQLQEQYADMVNSHRLFVDEILHLQKVVKSHHQVQRDLVAQLEKFEQEKREGHNANSSHSNHSTPGYGAGNVGYIPEQEVQPDLRRARDILNGISLDHAADPEIKRMSIAFHNQPGSSPESVSNMMAPPPGGPTQPMHTFFQNPFEDMRHMVYPVGQNIGIDPFAAEHVQNIPYNQPQHGNAMMAAHQEIPAQPMQSQTPPGSLQQQGGGSLWGVKKPVVLLVEDDKTCSRIGTKFLSQYECGVEVARDGIEAIDKVNKADPGHYDLIFMDIVMPRLDGISATAMIRQALPNVPIIAMTSNINQQDLDNYSHWGMRDVLAKPFTKDGMIGKLRRHLVHMLQNPPTDGMMDPMYQNAGAPHQQYQNQAMNMGPLSAASSGPVAKFDTTPIHSPATSTSWNSPSQIPQTSPTMTQDQGYMGAGSGSHMVLTPGGTQKPQQFQQGMVSNMGGPQRIHDAMQRQDGPPEKRQRLYAQQGGY